MTDIPISRPFLGEAELAAIQEPLRDGWIVQGPRVAEFEARFAEFCGAAHAVATTSCTTALHVALAALGAGPGDEVIVPAFTWVATANAVEYVGATPVFCDIALDTFNLDPEQLASVVTDRTVGIVPVHLFGRPADMDAIEALADRYGLWVVEDAACGLGARLADRHVGSIGQAGCFSFHPRKSITTGEGGMLITDDGAIAEAARSLRNHGASRSVHERHAAPGAFNLASFERLGFNYRMTDLQGALGLAQLQRADWILGERARQARRYEDALGGCEWLRTPDVPDDATHGWQAYVTLFVPDPPRLEDLPQLTARRDAMMGALEREGIGTRPGTHAPAAMDRYRRSYGLAHDGYPAAMLAEGLSVALPLFAGLSDDDLDRVVDTLLKLGPG